VNNQNPRANFVDGLAKTYVNEVKTWRSAIGFHKLQTTWKMIMNSKCMSS